VGLGRLAAMCAVGILRSEFRRAVQALQRMSGSGSGDGHLTNQDSLGAQARRKSGSDFGGNDFVQDLVGRFAIGIRVEVKNHTVAEDVGRHGANIVDTQVHSTAH
jgi:hypothetical protein